MKNICMVSLVLLLLVSPSAFAQTSRSKSAAIQSWPQFWEQFSAAINKKDRESLKKMMAADFYDGGGGGTATQYIKEIDEVKKWREHQRSVASGTKPYKLHKGLPARITKDNYLVFEFKNGRWWWWGIQTY